MRGQGDKFIFELLERPRAGGGNGGDVEWPAMALAGEVLRKRVSLKCHLSARSRGQRQPGRMESSQFPESYD